MVGDAHPLPLTTPTTEEDTSTGHATSRLQIAPLASMHPAVPMAVAIMCGIFAYTILPVWPGTYLSIAAAMAVCGVLLSKRERLACTALLVSIAFCGAALAQIAAYQFPARHIVSFTGIEPRLAQLEIELDSPPRLLIGEFAKFRPAPPRQVATAVVKRVMTWHGWEETTGRTLVQIAEPYPGLALGQTLRVLCRLERPSEAMNPGQFDWAHYYREQHIVVSVQIPHAENMRIIGERPLTWMESLRAETRRLLAAGFAPEHSLDHALLRALLLGDGDPELRDVQDQFRHTGTSHHLAISGMHVAVLGGVVFLILRLLRTPPRWGYVVAMVFVILYGIAALPSPPVVRSIVLFLMIGLGISSRRSVDALQLLAVTVLFMLVAAPLDVFGAGFQLSFGTVLGLILFTRALTHSMTRSHPLDPNAARPTPLVAVARKADSAVLRALVAGLVAWIVSMPMVAYHFSQVNPFAILASIILGPIVVMSLIGGMLKVALTMLLPSGAAWFASACGQPTAMMRWVVDLLARVPGSDVPLPTPALWLVMLYYVFLSVGLLYRKRLSIRWIARYGAVMTMMAILLLPMSLGATRIDADRGDLRLTMLSVGAGQCVVVEPPSGRLIIVDAGSTSLVDPIRKCIAPFLRARGYTEIDSIYLSHANYDHFGATAELVDAYGAREVLIGNGFREAVAHNPAGRDMLDALDELNRPPRIVAPGDRIPLGRDTEIEILWPTSAAVASGMSDNDTSLVFRLTHAGKTVLFTGDIQTAGMKALMTTPDKIRADVMMAPHHGSSEAITPTFLSAVNPQIILSSNDRTPTMKQRDFDGMTERFKVYRSNEYGAVTVTITRDGRIDVQPFLKRD